MHTSGRIIFFVVDLIDCAQSFDEMGRRIDVRSLMPDVSEKLRKKSFSHQSGLLVVPIIGLALFIGKTGPPRDAPCEFVSQIDKIFLAENFLDLSEGDVRSFLAGRPEWRSSGQ